MTVPNSSVVTNPLPSVSKSANACLNSATCSSVNFLDIACRCRGSRGGRGSYPTLLSSIGGGIRYTLLRSLSEILNAEFIREKFAAQAKD